MTALSAELGDILRGLPPEAKRKFDELDGSTVWPSIGDPRKFVLPDNLSERDFLHR
jgi:hypothetical protein